MRVNSIVVYYLGYLSWDVTNSFLEAVDCSYLIAIMANLLKYRSQLETSFKVSKFCCPWPNIVSREHNDEMCSGVLSS